MTLDALRGFAKTRYFNDIAFHDENQPLKRGPTRNNPASVVRARGRAE